VAWLSVYEKIERMQEKDAAKVYGGEFSVNLKSGGNIPSERFAPVNLKLRVMTSADDE
jgi:hypothetical protein